MATRSWETAGADVGLRGCDLDIYQIILRVHKRTSVNNVSPVPLATANDLRRRTVLKMIFKNFPWYSGYILQVRWTNL